MARPSPFTTCLGGGVSGAPPNPVHSSLHPHHAFAPRRLRHPSNPQRRPSLSRSVFFAFLGVLCVFARTCLSKCCAPGRKVRQKTQRISTALASSAMLSC